MSSLQDKINHIVDELLHAENGVELLEERKRLTDEFIQQALEVIKDDRISELEGTVKNLRQQLKTAKDRLYKVAVVLTAEQRLRLRHIALYNDHDHLPYEEDDRR